MGNDASTPFGRDEWARSGGTVVTAGRPSQSHDEALRKASREMPEQRRLSQRTAPLFRAGVTDNPRGGGRVEGFTERGGGGRATAASPQLTATNSSRPVSPFGMAAAIVDNDAGIVSPRQDSVGTPRSIMLRNTADGNYSRQGSCQSARSQEAAHQPKGFSTSAPTSTDDTGSEDSWTDDEGFDIGMGTYLLGMSEASISSRRFNSASERDNRRVGFGFNSTVSSHRKMPSFRTAQAPHVPPTSRTAEQSPSDVGEAGLTTSCELQSAAPDGCMPLAHFGEAGNMSRHGSVSFKGTPRAPLDTVCKRSAQTSVVFNNSVHVTDAPVQQDLLVGNANHRSSLARRAQSRSSPEGAPLKQHTAGDHTHSDDAMRLTRRPRVLSLEHA